MKLADLLPYEGKIAVLDLVNSEQITTKVKEIDQETGRVLLGQLIVYSHVPNPSEPGKAAVVHVPHAVQPTGATLIKPRDENPIDIEHIIFAYDPHPDIEKAFLHATSGIQLAGADAISRLDAAGQNPTANDGGQKIIV